MVSHIPRTSRIITNCCRSASHLVDYLLPQIWRTQFVYSVATKFDQTPLHLFVECPIAKSFWSKFTMWYNVTCEGNIALEQNEIIYGVLKYTSSGLTLNHLIIIAKYFLYILKQCKMKKDPSSQILQPSQTKKLN